MPAGYRPHVFWRTDLNLELATVVECDDTGCHVQLIPSNKTIQAAFSAKVRDRIRVRQQQLVAVDTSVNPPEISWRWFIGEVESTEGATASIRRLDMPAGSCEVIANADRVPVKAGDIVFYGHGEDYGVVARAANGRPENPAALAARYLPEVEATLKSLDS